VKAMMRRSAWWLVACLLSVAAQAQPLSASDAAVPLYELDPVETHSRFEAKFLGFITVRGKFNRTTGKLFHDPLRTDAESRANDSIEAQIDATTLDAHVVNAHATNEILRGPDFFNVEKFPTISFKSSRFNWDDDKLKSIDGRLTLLGVTKPVTLTVEQSGCTPAGNGKRARCTADAFVRVKRADFGMKAWSTSVGNEVKIIVELVAFAVPAVEKPQPPKAEPPKSETPKPESAENATPPTGDR
jgi:polyisoprenoid-binding protein YceI